MAPVPDETTGQRLLRNLGWAIRSCWPNRAVKRSVQGVDMVLPWSHRLPDYARVEPEYGQNLPRLAAAIARADGRPVVAMDIGANVGDSTLQILHATDGKILCVEGDRGYLKFLHRNLDSDDRVVIEESLLQGDDARAEVGAMAPLRSGGTTRFVPGESSNTLPSVTVEELRLRHPQFAQMRLVKSDTDGFDVALVPAVARVFRESRPVLFFEYDHTLTRLAGYDPLLVWDDLAELGYQHVRVWHNGGRPIGTYSIDQMSSAAAILDTPVETRSYHFWDVAVVHREDAAGLAALQEMSRLDPAATP